MTQLESRVEIGSHLAAAGARCAIGVPHLRHLRRYGNDVWMARVYLAGPDVFLPDAIEIGRRKCEQCRERGLEGLYPLDADIDVASAASRIFTSNCALMDRADAGLLNLTPFRGVSADAGTCFELGYLFRAGKPLFGYSSVPRDHRARVEQQWGPLTPGVHGPLDRNGHFVEDFGLFDNLMLIEALEKSGGGLWVVPANAFPSANASTSSNDSDSSNEPGSQLAAFAAFELALGAAAVAIG